MKPSDIRYSQQSISDTFSNGEKILDTYKLCIENPNVIKNIRCMRVFMKDGEWYSMDNRRLWLFKKLENDGYITDVPFQVVYEDEVPDDKFTTRNGGISVWTQEKILDTYKLCIENPNVIKNIRCMRVFMKDGEWYSMDNRRLWLFKKLENDGYITDVPVQVVYEDEVPDDKFTTRNGGISVWTQEKILDTYKLCIENPNVIKNIRCMRVFMKDGEWYSMHNRRLWLFKKLENDGYITDVPVQVVYEDEVPDDKFTTRNGGISVWVRYTN